MIKTKKLQLKSIFSFNRKQPNIFFSSPWFLISVKFSYIWFDYLWPVYVLLHKVEINSIVNILFQGQHGVAFYLLHSFEVILSLCQTLENNSSTWQGNYSNIGGSSSSWSFRFTNVSDFHQVCPLLHTCTIVCSPFTDNHKCYGRRQVIWRPQALGEMGWLWIKTEIT
jgi:hypothetical protein